MEDRVQIIPATYAHVVDLANRMRTADMDEVYASSGMTPLEASDLSLRASSEAWAVLFYDELACIWGVCPGSDSSAISRRGWVWMLTTDTVDQNKRLFMKCCWDILPSLLDRWDVLANAIDDRHHVALRWGARLGFQFRDPEPWGIDGLPFRFFTVTKEDVLCANQLH